MSQPAVHIPEKLFFKIGEVCEIAGVQAHVLRYWESEFSMLAPQKNRAGQRTYRRRDVEMALRIKELLYEEQYTIAGAKKRLMNDMRGQSRLKVVPDHPLQVNGAPTQPSLLRPDLGDADALPLMQGYSELATLGAGTAITREQRMALHRLSNELRDLLAMLDQSASNS